MAHINDYSNTFKNSLIFHAETRDEQQYNDIVAEAGSNPLKKKAAEIIAKKAKDTEYKKADQLEQQAQQKADQLMNAARAKADQIK